MPELIGCEYIVDWFFKVGILSYSGMGIVPLSFTEIRSWGKGLDMNHWEVQTIHDMSCEYVSYFQKASELNCPPPFSPQKTESQQVDLSKRFSSVLKSMSKPNKGKNNG